MTHPNEDTMSGHTAGEWCIEDPMGDEYWIVQAGKQAYEWEPLAAISKRPDKNSGITIKQAKANADLMVCAPEMLALLVKLKANFDQNNDMFWKIDALVSKATGATHER